MEKQIGSLTPRETGHSAKRPTEAAWRVLVVRDETLRDRVDRALTICDRSATVARVPGFLAAMGDLGQQEADVVIGPMDAAEGLLSSTGRALRELCPQARLLLVGEESSRAQSAEALSAGFDAVLIEPYDSNELAKAMSPSIAKPISPPASALPTLGAPAPPLPISVTPT